MRGATGFTLIELLAVLALLALGAVIAWPAPRLDATGTALRRAASALVEALAGARGAAERDGRERCVAIRPAEGDCATVALPDRVTAAAIPAGDIRFHPDGSSSGAIVRLTAESQARTIEVVGATGRILRR